MSGESGRASRQIQGQNVRAEQVIGKSFVENVTGFINEIVPQTYHNPSHYEGKERITWVRFDHCDINDLSQFRDRIECNGNAPPLLLIIGYVNGVQAWVIPASGVAVEVFSWRQGPVRTLKVLVSPSISDSSVDRFSLKRPILAICDAAGPGVQFHSVSFISLKTGEQVKTIKFKNAVQDIHSNKNVIVISFPEKLAVFEASSFEDLFTISTCYRCTGPSLNPIALGDQWLAFADRRLYSVHQSCGGMVIEGAASYKSTMLHAAKSIGKGLKEFTETVASNLMGQKGTGTSPLTVPITSAHPGVVTIVDTQKVTGNEVNLSQGITPGLIAHFLAHQGTPVVALQFDPSGTLLATADKLGHNFHLFRIQPHPISSSQAAVHHLYTLYRGDTTAKVMDISFSLDSRWIAVSTHRGTTHVYPITPYGGNIGMRTHKSVCVVNRLSRFQRSAGLDDTPSSGRNSPVLSASPGGPKLGYELTPNLAYPNPRYPPYPVPIILKPLVQLRQPLVQNLIETIAPGPSPSHSPPSNKSPKGVGPEEIVRVASIFGTSRGWFVGSPTVPREIKRQAVDSLFVMAYHGNLIEYYLEPKAISTIPIDKITDDSPIELEVHASAQWPLVRESTSHEIRPPLAPDSPILYPFGSLRRRSMSPSQPLENEDPEERWMAQVEIYTHAGPPRRLWMGPQFTFKSLPGTGTLVGDSTTETYTDPSLELPPRSSPVNMPGSRGSTLPVLIEAGSLTGSQSPRLLDRLSSESDPYEAENVMTRLRNDLADAMMDTHNHPIRRDSGGTSGREGESPNLVDDSAFDFSDVMDISCDPPGPSSNIGATSSAPEAPFLRPFRRQEEEIQSVTSKLHKVAVTSQSTGAEGLTPFWGSRTPSLEECRALTSSAEELASTLEQVKVKDEESSSNWTPVSLPSQNVSSSSFQRPVERPQPIDGRDAVKNVWDRSSVELRTKSSDDVCLRPSWSSVVESKTVSSDPSPVNDPFPLISGSLTKSATTSEDDLWPAKEGRKDNKRRRRKKNKHDDDDLASSGILARSRDLPIVSQSSSVGVSRSTLMEGSFQTNVLQPVPSPTSIEDRLSPASLEVDLDHFQTAEEFHDPLEALDPDEPLEDLGAEIKEDVVMMRSVHEGDDLARALEEASSDESIPVRTKKDNPREADEMFPFRETSSDEDDIELRVRRRNVLLVHTRPVIDEDDDRETSGDDRKTTSESDVTTSPNPRASSTSKGKKKKKKKK